MIGAALSFGDQAYTVIGVVPDAASTGIDQIHARAAYHAPYPRGGPVEAWLPLQVNEAAFPRYTHPFLLLGRLQPTVEPAAAQEAAAALALDLSAAIPSMLDVVSSWSRWSAWCSARSSRSSGCWSVRRPSC